MQLYMIFKRFLILKRLNTTVHRIKSKFLNTALRVHHNLVQFIFPDSSSTTLGLSDLHFPADTPQT